MPDLESQTKLKEIAQKIKKRQKTYQVAALTGAGLSVPHPSNIPDFTSENGLWSRYPKSEYATLKAFKKNPEKVWQMVFEVRDIILSAQPNIAHLALAELQRAGYIGPIFTQNIDGLHQQANNIIDPDNQYEVVELHGSATRLKCLKCNTTRSSTYVLNHKTDQIPHCPTCRAIEKPDVVFFDQLLPPEASRRFEALKESVKLWLVIGCSLQTAPAGLIPREVLPYADVYLFNLKQQESDYDGLVQGDIKITLPRLMNTIMNNNR